MADEYHYTTVRITKKLSAAKYSTRNPECHRTKTRRLNSTRHTGYCSTRTCSRNVTLLRNPGFLYPSCFSSITTGNWYQVPISRTGVLRLLQQVIGKTRIFAHPQASDGLMVEMRSIANCHILLDAADQILTHSNKTRICCSTRCAYVNF